MTLEARMRAALWGLYWLSNGATSRMDANRVTQSKDRPAFPSGEGFPLVDEFAPFAITSVAQWPAVKPNPSLRTQQTATGPPYGNTEKQNSTSGPGS